MVEFKLLEDQGILVIEPRDALSAEDFQKIGEAVDPYIEERGGLNGLLLYAEKFPGWEDFHALFTHLRFVRDHHRKVKKVAAVTDSTFLSMAPRITDHFVEAEVQHFELDARNEALDWLSE
jgi:hypothetical protein